MKKMQNLIVIGFDISSRNGDGFGSEDTDFDLVKSEVDKLTEIALQYINQHERVILKSSNGADIFYLGSAKEAMLMAIEFRDCMVAKNISARLPLYLRIGIHLEKIDASENNQVAPIIIRKANQQAKLLKNNANLNEILVSRDYFENTPKSIQAIATVYDLPVTSTEANLHKSDLTSDNGSKHRVRKSENAPILVMQNQVEPEPSESESSLTFTNLTTEKKIASHFFKRLNWFYIATSIPVCLIVFLLYQSEITKVDQIKTTHSTSKQSVKQKISVDERKLKKQEQVLLPINEQSTENVSQPKSNKTQKMDTNQPKNDNKTFWNKLVSSVKQGKKSECTQAEIVLKQCPK